MSCTPNRSSREQRMLRAIAHAVYSGHVLDPSCAGCLELAGFATVRGYAGDATRPTCWAREVSDPSALPRQPAGA